MSKQKEKSEATKRRLTESAKKLFYEKGFDKTSVREIVKAAGVAQGTFYLYFETKYDVLYEIYVSTFQVFNSFIDTLNLDAPSIDNIDYAIDTMVIYMEKNPDIIRLMHNARILEIMNMEKYKILTSWFLTSTIEKWIANASSKGVISKKPPELYAKIIMQIAHELLESAFLFGYPDNITIVKQETKQIIKDILS